MSAPSPRTVLARGLRRRCPACGEGRLFVGWYHHLPRCEVCGLNLDEGIAETWGFMYISTAALIGAYVFPIVIFRLPVTGWVRVALVASALGIALVSLPARKGLALALNFLVDRVGAPAPPEKNMGIETGGDRLYGSSAHDKEEDPVPPA